METFIIHWTYHVILNVIVFPYSFLILEELHLTQHQKTKIYHQYHQSRKTSPKLLLSKFSPPQLPSIELNTQHFCQCIHRICVYCSTKYAMLQFFVFVVFFFLLFLSFLLRILTRLKLGTVTSFTSVSVAFHSTWDILIYWESVWYSV